ncbi:MAG: DUF1080 domain-containing protein [Ardenticatenaceae bacterium]|nr:DUF1080 domain-containing protein [Ardenticatenaceae bacterium]
MKQSLLLLLLGISLAACLDTPDPNANILFQDQFAAGQTGAWILEGDAVGRTSILDESLLIEVNEPRTMQFATLEDPLFTDFDLSVDARILEGDIRGSLGILFRVQDPTQFYRFEITGDGLSLVERRNADGTWTRLVEDWTPSPAINQGTNASNQLRLIAVGPTLSFYVNGILLHRLQDGQYKAGAIALDAGTFGQGGLRVMFDNVVVQQVGGS